MKKFFYALVFFLILALIAWQFHLFFGEKICGICKADQEQNEAEPNESIKKLTAFQITDLEGNELFKFPEGFAINSMNGEVDIPENLAGIKDSVFIFLNKNQDKELLISAKFLENEGENRGLDRANFLKNFLESGSGINPNKIIPEAVMSDFSYDDSNNYAEGISMLFRNCSDETKEKVVQSIVNKNLYTDFGSTEFKADRTLQAYAFELKNHLSTNSDVRASVTGHTDNIGESDTNYTLGLKRAQNVVDYLVSQGISEDQIKAYSKGETEPLESNETEEGRAKNRRITISVQ